MNLVPVKLLRCCAAQKHCAADDRLSLEGARKVITRYKRDFDSDDGWEPERSLSLSNAARSIEAKARRGGDCILDVERDVERDAKEDPERQAPIPRQTAIRRRWPSRPSRPISISAFLDSFCISIAATQVREFPIRKMDHCG